MRTRIFGVLLGLGVLLIASAGPTPASVLCQGAQMNGSNGIYFDAQDRLYIASVVGREIVVMDRETGRVIDRLGPDEGVNAPDDVFVGPDGSLYWTAILTGEVGRRWPDGRVKTQFVAPGVNPITLSDEGRLFTALDFLGDGFYEVDPELEEPPVLLHGPLGYLNGMDFGPDGFLYGPIFTQGKVVRIDVNVDPVVVETFVEGFVIPVALKFDSRGRMHVLDAVQGTVNRVDLETRAIEVVGHLEPGMDNLAFDSADRLFTSSFTNGSISEVLSDGTVRSVSPRGVNSPGGVAVMPRADGNSVFVADQSGIREMDGETGVELSFAPDLFLPGVSLTANSMWWDGEHMIVSAWFSSIVAVWDPVTRMPLEEYDEFLFPVDALRFQGDVVVSELGMGRVARKTEAGLIPLIDGDDGLIYPSGLAVSGGDLWVADWATGVVWQLADDGELFEAPIAVASGLVTPEGLAVDLDGSLLVVESQAGRLSRVDVSTGAVRPIAVGLAIGREADPGMPAHWGFTGVDVAPSGTIYVSGELDQLIYRFEPVASTPGACQPDNEMLCLAGGRFGVETSWRKPGGASGPGQVAGAQTSLAGNFSFFDPENLEVLVKIMNGCAVNGNHWAFLAGATNVRYVVTITDFETGFSKMYGNEEGTAGDTVLDTSFELCD